MGQVDRAEFERKGFLSPLRCMAPEEMTAYYDRCMALVAKPSPLWDHADFDWQRHMRNRHLDSQLVLDLATHPQILDAIAAVLGPDLILWRSDFFVQGKSDPEMRWHQDRQQSGPRRLPSLVLPGPDGKPPSEPYNEDAIKGDVPLPRAVSAWLAIGDTDRTTGCVRVVEGSNHEGVIGMRKARDGEPAFYGKGTVLDYEIPEDRVRYMELRAGEFFIFERLTVHASVPTVSDRPRMGLSLRYTVPDVIVYPGYTVDGQGFSTEHYKALLVRGEDRFGYNRAWLETPDERRQRLAAPAR